jgi:hypothetical protein
MAAALTREGALTVLLLKKLLWRYSQTEILFNLNGTNINYIDLIICHCVHESKTEFDSIYRMILTCFKEIDLRIGSGNESCISKGISGQSPRPPIVPPVQKSRVLLP